MAEFEVGGGRETPADADALEGVVNEPMDVVEAEDQLIWKKVNGRV